MDPLHFVWRRFVWPFLRQIRSNHNAKKASNNYGKLLAGCPMVKSASIKVAFLVNESSKWKYEALFSMLADDQRYSPIVLLTCADIDWQLNREERQAKLDSNKAFFGRRGFRCELAYDGQKDTAISLKKFHPDVVFYQHPWEISPCQSPLAVSKYALTFYVPYFLPTYGIPELECRQDFHRNLFCHVVLNKDWVHYYAKYLGRDIYSGKLMPLGHPMLDVYWQMAHKKKVLEADRWVIYAPHWSIPHPKNTNALNLSTFMETGRPMLEYALRHPEIKWLFKPHPTLRTVLYKILPRQEVDDYYAQWERLGKVCYNGDYVELFFESQALITDCDSFLIEYVFSGNPIIHLKHDGYNVESRSPFVELFETYYKVYTADELESTIDYVVIKQNDPNKQRRLELMKSLELCRNDCSSKIVKYLNSIFFNDVNLEKLEH